MDTTKHTRVWSLLQAGAGAGACVIGVFGLQAYGGEPLALTLAGLVSLGGYWSFARGFLRCQ